MIESPKRPTGERSTARANDEPGHAGLPRADLIVIGGGLAGSEAAWTAAEAGLAVELWEMRPERETPAHRTAHLAELVCSNSLGSALPDRAGGLLQAELRRAGSLIMRVADATAVPAGGALAVDRDAFAAEVTAAVEGHPAIRVVRREATRVPETPTVVATGPLTSDAFAEALMQITGEEYLYFYDALSPIVAADTIDMGVAFRGSRYGRGSEEEGDYINCPMDEAEYQGFVSALLAAERIELRDFEREDARFFEGCLPVEEIAARGRQALAFGPLRPVGLTDPRTGRRPHAVVQLRQDDLAASFYNLVGFQTNLRWPEQRRVFRLIPGLAEARFERLGQMHRNTYLNAPALLSPTLQLRERADLFFAGQITGIEGYVGNAASGWLAGVNAGRLLTGRDPTVAPVTSMIGALAHYVTHAEPKHFQPMKANFGLLPPPEGQARGKRRRAAQVERARADFERFLAEQETYVYDRA